VNTQSPNNPHHQHGPERVKRVEVYWHAVSYKQLIAYLLILGALIFAAVYFVTPGFYAAIIKRVVSDTDSDDAVAEALRSLVTIVRRGEIRGASRARAYRGGDSVVRGSS